MKNLPMIVTKIELVPAYQNYYRVTFNLIWRLINDSNQIKEAADNWDEIKHIITPIERKRKIYKLMNKEFIIYKEKILFQKNNY